MIESGTANAGEDVSTPGATVKTTSDISPETGSVAPEGGQNPSGESAGDSQEFSEGGSDDGRQGRFSGRSKLGTIRELRAKLREERSQRESLVGDLQSRLDNLEAKLRPAQNDQRPSRTFWEAPEDVSRELTRAELKSFKEELLGELRQTEQEREQTAEWKQETSEATKFIRTQKGLTPEDEEEVADIVRSTPSMMNLRPMERAEYAMFLWQKQKGIGDKSSIKARASTVAGSTTSTGGKRIWTDADMKREIDKFSGSKWTPEQVKAFDVLNREFEDAVRENRLK